MSFGSFGGGQSAVNGGSVLATGLGGQASTTNVFGGGTKPSGTGLFGPTAATTSFPSNTGAAPGGSGGSETSGGTSTAGNGGSKGTTSFGFGSFGGFGSSAGASRSSTTTQTPAGSSAFAGQAATGGLFGSSAKTTSGSAPASTSLFGGGGSANQAKNSLFPNTASTIAAAPAATTGAPPSAATSNIFSSFKPTTTSSSPTTTTPVDHSAKPNLFSGVNTTAATTTVGGANLAPSSTSTGTSANPATASLFGQPKTEKTDAGSSSTTVPSLGAGFFGTNKAPDNKEAAENTPSTTTVGMAPTTTAFSLGSLGSNTSSKEAQKPKDSTVTGAQGTANVAVPPPSMLRGKTIEEIVNRWSTELETHTRDFNNFAGEIAVWDRALIENANDLNTLYKHVMDAEREQTEVDQSLDHVEQQQRELSSALDVYEKTLGDLFSSGQAGGFRALENGPAESERDKSYLLASELHAHLEDLSRSLMEMIDSVNALTLSAPASTATGAEDPMAQIAQILSGHLESLQWIDGTVHELESRVVEVDKQIKESGFGQQSGQAASLYTSRHRSYGR